MEHTDTGLLYLLDRHLGCQGCCSPTQAITPQRPKPPLPKERSANRLCFLYRCCGSGILACSCPATPPLLLPAVPKANAVRLLCSLLLQDSCSKFRSAVHHRPAAPLMQVLGLTQYSHWPEATQVRRCVQRWRQLQAQASQMARKRLHTFLHVGLTEQLELSILTLAVSR